MIAIYKKISALYMCILLLQLSACSKYEPIYGVVGNETLATPELRYDLAYIYDNEVYLSNEILTDQLKLTNNSNSTNSPYTTKTHVALSPDLDKIAYLDANGTPVIIDILGNQLNRLTQFNNVKDIGWHANNGNTTLYILVNNTLEFWGPSLNLVNAPFDFVFPSTALFTTIDAIDINENLDIAFSYRYYQPITTSSLYHEYYYGVGIQYSSSALVDKNYQIYDNFYTHSTQLYSNELFIFYHMVRFNNANGGVDLAETVNTKENNNDFQWLRNYQALSATINNINSINSACYYEANNKGEVVANVYQIQKYFVNLPQGVFPPSGSSNTFTLNFDNANNSLPTYFEWQP